MHSCNQGSVAFALAFPDFAQGVSRGVDDHFILRVIQDDSKQAFLRFRFVKLTQVHCYIIAASQIGRLVVHESDQVNNG